MINKIISCLFLFNLGICIYASEITFDGSGLITRIYDTDIDFRKVGVLKYDYIIPSAEKIIILKYLEDRARSEKINLGYTIIGSKNINDYILIVCDEKGARDAGIEIVYSVKLKKVIGEFHGGERG